jgi:hypothetical protein
VGVIGEDFDAHWAIGLRPYYQRAGRAG